MTDQQWSFRQELRQEAEARLRRQGLDRLPSDLHEAEELLEELRIHHVELDIQNEELRRAERELEWSHLQYQILYRQAPLGYFVLDLNGVILSLNRAGASLLGYAPVQVVGTRFERFVSHAQRDAFYLHRQQVIDTGQRQQVELLLLTADRSPRYAVLESILRPPEEEGEDQPRLLVAVLDRTEEHRAQEAYRRLVEESLQGLAIFQDERLVFANPALAEITGYSVAELLAMDQAELNRHIHPEDQEWLWQRAEKRLAGQAAPTGHELRFIHRSGQTRWVEIHNVLIEFQGRPAIQTALLDITGRKTAEQALEQSQRFIERVSNVAPVVIYVYDLVEGQNVYINEQIELILGYTTGAFAAFQTDLLNVLIHPDDRLRIESYLAQLAVGELEEPVYEYEYRMRHASGGWRWMLSRDVVFRRTAEGLPRQILGAMQDITERRQREAEREQLLQEVHDQREELRALSARLAELRETERESLSRELHDRVGQNLTALGFNLKYIRGQLSAASAEAIADRLDDSLALLEGTTDRIRDLMADLRPPMMEQDGLVDSLEWYAEQYAARTGLEIRVEDRTERHRLAPAAEIGLFRIVQEALTNVAKHAQAETVQVTLERVEDHYRLVVADDGVGFEPAPPGGMPSGQLRLGLLTMRERAEAINGRLRIESEPGQGTTVIAEVPAI